MDSYHVWITLSGMHLDEIPGGLLDSILQHIWDEGGIAGRFQIAQHEEDQVVFCVKRSLYDDIELLIGRASDEDPHPVFIRGIGNRVIPYDEGSFDGVEVSRKAAVAQFRAEYQEALNLVDPGGCHMDLFKRAKITAAPPDPTLSGPAILP
jgi:hypothetical protein